MLVTQLLQWMQRMARREQWWKRSSSRRCWALCYLRLGAVQ
jgi:hypothetical protein